MQTKLGHTCQGHTGTQQQSPEQFSSSTSADQMTALGSVMFQRPYRHCSRCFWHLVFWTNASPTIHRVRSNSIWKPDLLCLSGGISCAGFWKWCSTVHSFSIRPCFANGATSKIHGLCLTQAFASLPFSWEEYACLLIKAGCLSSYSHCWLPAIMPIVVWVENVHFSNLIYSI